MVLLHSQYVLQMENKSYILDIKTDKNKGNKQNETNKLANSKDMFK